jgi:hypothetical protein
VIASIEEPELIERILAHQRERGEEAAPAASLGARAPPQASRDERPKRYARRVASSSLASLRSKLRDSAPTTRASASATASAKSTPFIV